MCTERASDGYNIAVVDFLLFLRSLCFSENCRKLNDEKSVIDHCFVLNMCLWIEGLFLAVVRCVKMKMYVELGEGRGGEKRRWETYP